MRGEVLRSKSAEGTFVRRGVLRRSAEKGGRGLKRGSAEGESAEKESAEKESAERGVLRRGSAEEESAERGVLRRGSAEGSEVLREVKC